MKYSAIVVLLAASLLSAQTGPNDARAREIYKELVEINTTDTPAGNVTKAAEAVAARLKAAGFPAADMQILGPDPRKGNLVFRYRGTGAGRPLLLLAHLDVVEAKREDWSMDPPTFVEKYGFFYGRGTSDDKAMASQFVANLIRLKEEGFKPDRDLILALTADEEGGDFNGAEWLVKNHKDLIDAEFAINEGGGGSMRKGKYLTNEVQASEKVYQDFHLEVANPGGHSSLPVKDNAIYHLSAGLARLSAYEFPVELNEVTRAYFALADVKRIRSWRRHACRHQGHPGCRRRRAIVGVAAVLQRDDADDLRGNQAARRPRHQRPAANGERERQLPHSAGSLSCIGQGEARRRARRSEDHRRLCRRGAPQQTVAPASRRHEPRRIAHEADVPGRRRSAGDEHGRHRRSVSTATARFRHTASRARSATWTMCARTARTSASA
jgi:hypothetical protein